MKIGIQATSGTFSDRWIPYCESKGIPYKLVDCYQTDIIEQLSNCDALMWHYNHKDSKDSKFAKQLLFSIQKAGKKVFPDFNTAWHFDDKVGQKYLLEAIGAPLAPAYVFYSMHEAIVWAGSTNYPKVFKLRNGAGSDNVRLARNRREAVVLIKKSFGRGFKQYNAWSNLGERIRKYRNGMTTLWDVFKGIVRLLMSARKLTERELY